MRRALLAAALCTAAGAARAHNADILYVRAGADPSAPGVVRETASMTAATLQLLAPVDADGDGAVTAEELAARRDAVALGVWDSMPLFAAGAPCRRTGTTAALGQGYVELGATFACAQGELQQVFRVLSLLPGNYRVVLATGSAPEQFAEGPHQTLFLASSSPRPAQGPSGLAGWLWMGALHIFTGYDHLAFLLGLLLVAQDVRRLLYVVTSFTIAHSLTLGATALGFVDIGPAGARWVEIAIAASIVYVALDNLLREEQRHREWVTFGFGLVHGFGFASVLRSYGLGDSTVAALAGFNLGVEAGQAAIVASVFPLLALLRARTRFSAKAIRAGSRGVGAAGAFWLAVRLLA